MQRAITRYTVLFVESEPADIELARQAATGCRPEFDLHVVVDTDEALEWLFIAPPALLPLIVVLDLKLPKLNGLAVLRTLRLNPATRELPVLVYSTEFTQADVLMSYQAGANSFVAKPTDEHQFADFFTCQLAYWLASKHQHLDCATS